MEHGFRLFLDLDTGAQQPETEAQRHFVKVCRGDAAPVTLQGRVYMNIQAERWWTSHDPEESGPKPCARRRDLGPREWDHYEYNKCK